MAQDFYGTEAEAPAAKESEMEESGEETALVPKSMLGGNCKVGDTYKVRVANIFDSEAELELVKEEKKKEASEATDEVETRMNAMAE